MIEDNLYWIVPLVIVIFLYLYDIKQEKTVNLIYDDRNIDHTDEASLYRHQTDNIRDLQLVLKLRFSNFLLKFDIHFQDLPFLQEKKVLCL